jgi:hypothetical protein
LLVAWYGFRTKREPRQFIGERIRDKIAAAAGICATGITRKDANASSRLIALHDQREQTRRSLARVDAEIIQLHAEQINDLDVSKAFADFDNVWNALNTLEKSEVLSLLVSRIEFDSSDSSLSIEMHPAGIKSLATNLEESTTSSKSNSKSPWTSGRSRSRAKISESTNRSTAAARY